jgi:hypothetical protein
MIPAVMERCAGVDIGKTFLVAGIMVVGAADAEPRTEKRAYYKTLQITASRVFRLEQLDLVARDSS